MAELKLKPCPFCGGEARPIIYHNKECTYIRHYVQCRCCDVCTPKYLEREIAIEAWNRRYTPPSEIDFDYGAED